MNKPSAQPMPERDPEYDPSLEDFAVGDPPDCDTSCPWEVVDSRRCRECEDRDRERLGYLKGKLEAAEADLEAIEREARESLIGGPPRQAPEPETASDLPLSCWARDPTNLPEECERCYAYLRAELAERQCYRCEFYCTPPTNPAPAAGPEISPFGGPVSPTAGVAYCLARLRHTGDPTGGRASTLLEVVYDLLAEANGMTCAVCQAREAAPSTGASGQAQAEGAGREQGVRS